MPASSYNRPYNNQTNKPTPKVKPPMPKATKAPKGSGMTRDKDDKAPC